MGDHAGWDREYNLLPVKLNFLVVMGMARVFPEEGGAKNVRGKRYFTLCLQGMWSCGKQRQNIYCQGIEEAWNL